MISCCTNEHAVGYSDLGGRGVRVCEAWLNSFASFLKDVGERPGPDNTLELIDGEGHFEPGNVRWTSTRGREWENSRDDSLDLERIRVDIRDLAKDFGVHPSILSFRLLRQLLRYQ
jgi:hypothetical protein